jgi:hypothetical protein
MTIKCACGARLTKRNIRNSGMAVCRCGNNFTAEMFDSDADRDADRDAEAARADYAINLDRWTPDGVYRG